MVSMNAAVAAWDWLEAKEPGLYEGMVASVLEQGATLVQDADFLLAFKAEGGCAHVLFAYGSLRKIVAFAHANAGVWGYERVSWERTLCGKRNRTNIYKLNRLKVCKKERYST